MVFSKVFFSFLIVWWRHRILGLLLRVYSKRPNFGFSYRLSFGFLYYSTIRSDSVCYCWVPDFCLHVSVWPCALVHGSHCQLCVLSSGLLWLFWILAFLQHVECESKMTEWWLCDGSISDVPLMGADSSQLPDEHKHSHAEAQAHTINK